MTRHWQTTAWVATVATVLLGSAAACERPPVDGTVDGGAGEGRLAVNFLAFAQDRPAVGGDWYLYKEEAGHLLEPFDHVYVVKSGPAGTPSYGAVRLVSYYDPDTAESGRFTVRTGRWDGATWETTEAILLQKNIKSDGPSCLDLEGPALEVNCADNTWQVMLRAYPFLAREGPIVVTRPGLFVRSTAATDVDGRAKIATVDGSTTIDSLPDPSTIEDLDDGARTDWGPVSYNLGQYAANLPLKGMAVGTRFVNDGFGARDDVFFLVNAVRSMVRFQVRPNVDGVVEPGLQLTWSNDEIDLDDNTISDTPSDRLMADIPIPDVGETIFLSFEEPDLVMDAQYLADAQLPHLPPNERRWDLALTQPTEGDVRLVLSPSAAIYNASDADPAVDIVSAIPPR